MMYAYILLTLMLYLVFLWVLAFHFRGTDLLGLADAVYALTHTDMTEAHQGNSVASLLFYTLMVGTVGGAGAIGLGHELSHRTREPLATFIARVAGIPAAFTYYAIEHGPGHHITVATDDDSSTALRGESLYRYFLRTMPRDYRMAWDIETDRMRRLGLSKFSWKNRLLHGWAAEAALFLAVTWVSGFMGLLFFSLAALCKAVYNATGARLREIPFTPERVWAALAGCFVDALCLQARHLWTALRHYARSGFGS